MLIGVDHGNKQIKTVHCAPFVSGLQQSMTRPFGLSLQYGGNYYTLSNERIPYRKDKTGDDRFFILTLIAIAEELTARGVDEKELYRRVVCQFHLFRRRLLLYLRCKSRIFWESPHRYDGL